MQVTIRGKRWELLFKKLPGGDVGQCQSPSSLNKKIIIDPSQSELDILGTTVHELMHAAYWDLDEEAIDSSSMDIARVLWRLGYRRNE
jgi:hypothetical protein